ncbi:MAG TPA: isochorismatase family cysteine hydrolase [Fibrobacteria bacterium]|nr:isochorismatase family cysteine hydrolase [Fibrobacteria bacterium]
MAADIGNTALLVMDVQPGIVQRLPEPDAYVAKVRAAVEVARERGVPVFFVVVGFRSGFPEINPRNKSFGAMQAAPPLHMVDPRPVIEPVPGEVVVTKRRVSAFTGSDLEVLLRSRDIRHLVLAGVSTSGVVLSTTREAADKDFQITILSDLCADFDPEVHRVLTEKVFPRQATVIACADWTNSLS